MVVMGENARLEQVLSKHNSVERLQPFKTYQGALLTIVFFKAIDQYAHAIIPQLYAPIMQGSRKQRPRWMESEASNYNSARSHSALGTFNNIPFTLLLFDSNFVSMTDMAGD